MHFALWDELNEPLGSRDIWSVPHRLHIESLVPCWQHYFGRCWNFRRWGIVEGSWSLGVCTWRVTCLWLLPAHPLLFPGCHRWAVSTATHCHLHDILHHLAQSNRTNRTWTGTFEPTAKINSSFKLLLSGICHCDERVTNTVRNEDDVSHTGRLWSKCSPDTTSLNSHNSLVR
jgi:hypothetical protein